MLRFKYLHKDVPNNIVWMNLEFLKNTRNHPNILKYLFHPKHQTRIEQEDWYYTNYSLDNNHLLWIAYDEKRSCPIGYVQYHLESLIHRRCSVNYVVANEFSACKYEKKIIKWMLNNIKGFVDEYHRVTAMVFPEDEERIKNYCDCGFEMDGVLRDYVYRDCQYRDVDVFSILL